VRFALEQFMSPYEGLCNLQDDGLNGQAYAGKYMLQDTLQGRGKSSSTATRPTGFSELPPREQLAIYGVKYLGDRELIALILRSGSAQVGHVLDIAQALLTEHSGIDGLSRSTLSELRTTAGIGLAHASAILAAFELGCRVKRISAHQIQEIRTSHDAFAYLRPEMTDEDRENFFVLGLNVRSQPILVHRVAIGSLSEVHVHPREVFRSLVRRGAHSAIIAHNHPSGDPEPSMIDINMTKNIVSAGQILGITVIDHLIIGGDSFVSLCDQGLMPIN